MIAPRRAPAIALENTFSLMNFKKVTALKRKLKSPKKTSNSYSRKASPLPAATNVKKISKRSQRRI